MLLPPPHIVLGGVCQGVVELIIPLVHHVPVPVCLLQSKENKRQAKFVHETIGEEQIFLKSLGQCRRDHLRDLHIYDLIWQPTMTALLRFTTWWHHQ
jgi:hypothetical protein